MAASKILVIFHPETQQPLRVVDADSDEEISLHIQSGEAYALVDRRRYASVTPSELPSIIAEAAKGMRLTR